MTLAEMVAACEELDSVINFKKEIASYDWSRRPEVPTWMTDANSKYLRMLSAWCKLFNCQQVMEVGTGYGASALALAQHAEVVVTADIRFNQVPDPQILTGKIRPLLLTSENHCRKLDYEEWDLLFIDIGDHTGTHEQAIHERLNQTYEGIAFYDDVEWEGMKPFWESITNDKIKPVWHGAAGFGIVRYGEVK